MVKQKTLYVLLAFLFVGTTAFSQFTLNGTINDANGEPLIGATILEKGTPNGTVADIDGNYSLNVTKNDAVLVINYTGYAEMLQTVNSSMKSLDIVMESSATALDEVVVTGLASSVKRSNLANAVASIDAKELTGVTSQSTMDGALYGKFSGADIRANSGAPGGGFSIRLRGVTSVSLNQQPVYIVDGVYMDNSTISLGTDIVTSAAGGGNTATNQDDASNRIADLIPEDIESIEILKGASAAAIYGVGGAGGVVLITTKRGKFNQDLRVNFAQTIGTNQSTRLLGDRGWDRAKVADVFGEDEAARFDANGTNDYEKEVFGNSVLNAISALSVYGGSETTKYYVSGTWRNQDGFVPGTGYTKSSVRANISNKLSKKLNLDITSSYVRSSADRGLFNNSNANTTVGYAMAFTRPWDDLFADENGNFPANPRVGSNVVETVNTITNNENLSRFFGSMRLTYTLMQTDNQVLKAGIEGGLDNYTMKVRGIFPQQLSFFRDPTSLGGVSIAGFGLSRRTNFSAFAVHDYYTDDLNLTTQAGVIQLDQDLDNVTTIASGLNGSQTNVDQAANLSTGQNIVRSQIKGFFAQEEVNWADKLILTLGIRGDKSSNNGDPNKIFWNPKASLAFNVHEFTDLGGTISQLKPRVAFGRSARFAGFNDRFNSLDGSLIEGNAGLVTSSLRGNPDVAPETQTELEFGLDLGFLKNRILLTTSFYNKTIDDLLLRAQVPASTGFTNQVVNAGQLVNRGIELGLEAEVVRSGDLSWAVGFNWWRNRSEVTRLDIPAFNTGGFAAFLGQGRIQEGQSATQLGGSIDPSLCDNGDCSNVDPEGDGFMTFGDMEADFNLSWVNSIAWKGLEVNWLFHWKQGGDGINLSTLLYDLGSVTWDYDDTNLDPSGQLSNGDFRLAALGTHPGVYIEDAGYMRLRELGVYYTVPSKSWSNDLIRNMKIGFSGRNLINIFDYNSYDPEVSNFGNNVLINSVEVTPYPSARTMNFHLNLTF